MNQMNDKCVLCKKSIELKDRTDTKEGLMHFRCAVGDGGKIPTMRDEGKIPKEWTIEGKKAIGRYGSPQIVYSGGRRKKEKHWPITITIELEDGNLHVCIDDEITFSTDSYTTADIPLEVLAALGLFVREEKV